MLAALALLAGSGCHKSWPEHPDWVIHSRVVFLSEDLGTEREPLPRAQFRLLFPYIAGDLYGSPTTGDFINPTLQADGRFEIDLNRSHDALLASLEPTQFSLSYLHIEPAQARVARLVPLVLQADGIEPLGRADWVDPDSKRALLLLYLDRAAKISGRGVAGGRPLRYAIQATASGYVWVAQEGGADESLYTVIPRPARLVLAVRPLADDHPALPAPTRGASEGKSLGTPGPGGIE